VRARILRVCPAAWEHGFDCRVDETQATQDPRSSLKDQLRGFPDFWRPVDPIES